MPVALSLAATNLMAYLQNPAVQIVAHLAKGAITPVNNELTLASFIECDFAGYVSKPLTDWEPVVIDQDDYAEALSPQVEWIAGDGIVPQTVTGVFVTAADGVNPPVLVTAAILPNPLVLDTPGAMIPYQFRMSNAEIPGP